MSVGRGRKQEFQFKISFYIALLLIFSVHTRVNDFWYGEEGVVYTFKYGIELSLPADYQTFTTLRFFYFLSSFKNFPIINIFF